MEKPEVKCLLKGTVVMAFGSLLAANEPQRSVIHRKLSDNILIHLNYRRSASVAHNHLEVHNLEDSIFA